MRISATDWMPDGNTDEDAVEIARAFIEHGAAAIDVSSGQVSKDEKPAFGRSYQTPFADKIRHRVAEPAGAKVIAVGAISSYDDVNSILLAGRADLCALGRTHLYDPQLDAARRRRAGATTVPVPSGRCRGRPGAASRRRRGPTRSRRGCSCCATAWPTTSTCGGRPEPPQ